MRSTGRQAVKREETDILRDFGQEKFDVVIQAGQSNSEGSGFGDASTPFTPEERIWFLQGDMTLSQAAEKVEGNRVVGNFSLAFAERYIQEGMLAEGRKLMILRAAVGGTGFSDHRWGPGDDLQKRMIDMIAASLGLNGENQVVAMLWHQGETDAYNQVDIRTHYGNLATLVQRTREASGIEDLPFLAGDFVEDWKKDNAAISLPIVSAMRTFCVDATAAGFVESTGLLSNDEAIHDGDTIHFCRESLYKLGRRYFARYQRIVACRQESRDLSATSSED